MKFYDVFNQFLSFYAAKIIIKFEYLQMMHSFNYLETFQKSIAKKS